MTKKTDFQSIIEKIDYLEERIFSEGGDNERGIHPQVHRLEDKLKELDKKLDTILNLLKNEGV